MKPEELEEMINLMLDKSFPIKSTPFICLDENDRIVSANELALKAIGYTTPRELNWCLREPGKKALDSVLYAERNQKIKSPPIERIVIDTKDNKELVLYNLKVFVINSKTYTLDSKVYVAENGPSIISFERAEKNDVRRLCYESDICFRAPSDFDYTRADKTPNCEVKDWLEYVMKYCLNNLDIETSGLEHKVEINLRDVREIGDEVVSTITTGLKNPRLLLSNPNPKIYKRLMENGFSKENIRICNFPMRIGA